MSVPINIDDLKISKEIADQIIIDWAKANNPHKRIVCCWRGQWFDLRSLDEDRINFVLEIISGIKPTRENTANIEMKI